MQLRLVYWREAHGGGGVGRGHIVEGVGIEAHLHGRVGRVISQHDIRETTLQIPLWSWMAISIQGDVGVLRQHGTVAIVPRRVGEDHQGVLGQRLREGDTPLLLRVITGGEIQVELIHEGIAQEKEGRTVG